MLNILQTSIVQNLLLIKSKLLESCHQELFFCILDSMITIVTCVFITLSAFIFFLICSETFFLQINLSTKGLEYYFGHFAPFSEIYYSAFALISLKIASFQLKKLAHQNKLMYLVSGKDLRYNAFHERLAQISRENYAFHYHFLVSQDKTNKYFLNYIKCSTPEELKEHSDYIFADKYQAFESMAVIQIFVGGYVYHNNEQTFSGDHAWELIRLMLDFPSNSLDGKHSNNELFANYYREKLEATAYFPNRKINPTLYNDGKKRYADYLKKLSP